MKRRKGWKSKKLKQKCGINANKERIHKAENRIGMGGGVQGINDKKEMMKTKKE